MPDRTILIVGRGETEEVLAANLGRRALPALVEALAILGLDTSALRAPEPPRIMVDVPDPGREERVARIKRDAEFRRQRKNERRMRKGRA
jgi:hypothetical protein